MKKEPRINLINAREKHQWSRNDVANNLGVAKVTIRSIETGNRNPEFKLAANFSQLFDLDVSELFPDIFWASNDTKSDLKKETIK